MELPPADGRAAAAASGAPSVGDARGPRLALIAPEVIDKLEHEDKTVTL